MFKKLFKNKPIGFYFSLAVSALSLFLMIFYAVYMSAHDLFNAGSFVPYLFAFLLPIVFFFVEENSLTRFIPIAQVVLLALAFGIMAADVGIILVSWFTGSTMLIGTTASGGVLLAILIITLVAFVLALVASFMKQTKPLTAEQQAEVDESWAGFKSNTKVFAVKHKKSLIISGAAFAVFIAFIVVLIVVIIPAALFVHVDGIVLDKDSVVMYETETLKLNAAIDPEDAENPNIEFTSSDEDVVTVSESGVLEAVGVGTATITVESEDGGYTDECAVEVKELTVTKTEIASMPNVIHYVKGDKLDTGGISIVATLTNGKTEKINARQHKLSYDVETIDAKEVTVTASYEYRGKQFDVKFNVYGDVAEVTNATEFINALEDKDNIDYIRFEGVESIAFDGELQIGRDITIEGVLAADSISLANDANVTVIGRINNYDETATEPQEKTLTVSGSGTLDVQTVYDDRNPGSNGAMDAYTSGIFSTGDMHISGIKLITTGLHADNGDLTVSGGADVVINGPGYAGRSSTYNGIDVYNGTVTVDGAKLAVMYDGETYVNRAAIQCKGITVDNGATLIVDKNENSPYHYGFAVWNNSSYSVTVSGGSVAKFNATALDAGRTDNQCFSSGLETLDVIENSTFEMNAVRYFNSNISGKFESDCTITVNGVRFDMSKPKEEIAFGEIGISDISVIVDENATFTAGETFTGEGILVEAVFGTDFGSGKWELRAGVDSGFSVEPVVLVSGNNTVKVTAFGEEYVLDIFADFAEAQKTTVSTAEGFKSALADENIKYIIVNGELSLGDVTISRDLWIEGNIKVNNITVNKDVTLDVIGRIWSDGNMTISGEGTINATEYAPESGTLIRPEYASIRSGGTLTISGTTVECSNLATNGDLTIQDGAKVTVYGKNARGTEGTGVNGIHASGYAVKVIGADTELNVKFKDASCNYSPAPIEANSVYVDGATVYVGSETGASWAFGIWFSGGESKLTVTNGAQVTLDIRNPGYNSVFSGSEPHVYVEEGTSATGEKTKLHIIAPADKFQQDIVEGDSGLVVWEAFG